RRWEGGRLDRPAWRWAQPRPRPREDVFERPVPTVAGEDRGAETGERIALRVGPDGSGGDQRLREWDGCVARAAAEDELARGLVHFHDRAGALSVGRVNRRVAGRQLVLLHREAEAMVQRILHRARRALGL